MNFQACFEVSLIKITVYKIESLNKEAFKNPLNRNFLFISRAETFLQFEIQIGQKRENNLYNLMIRYLAA